ncbi:MAG: 16S rRNA (adenine(1518)-N(6)/adenine(1519)-N(6))-dimethyltransferase RsmA [Isosphaeraceae bacterium]
MARQRQTQSYLRTLFAQRGVAPQHRFGQNFLVDLNIHDVIVKAAEVGPDDVVLEVGPGAGAMTALMASTGAAVVAVDIDPAMVALAGEAVLGLPNVRVLNADALAGKHVLNPEVLDNVRAGLAVSPSRKFKLVSNLPYNVATPVITNLLVHPELCPSRIVVTIQLELAERMRAEPGTAHYGALSVLVQALTDFELVRVLPPSVFWPRPKVESAVVRLDPNPAKRAEITDLPWFHSVVRQIFLHRRKNLRGVLFSLYKPAWTKPEVDALLESLGLDGSIRAEAMNVEEFQSLATALRDRFKAAETPEPADE